MFRLYLPREIGKRVKLLTQYQYIQLQYVEQILDSTFCDTHNVDELLLVVKIIHREQNNA